jgi:hypothetical protein
MCMITEHQRGWVFTLYEDGRYLDLVRLEDIEHGNDTRQGRKDGAQDDRPEGQSGITVVSIRYDEVGDIVSFVRSG